MARTTRATRPLWPPEADCGSPAPLSEAERAKAAAHRQQAARKLKIASVLAAAELSEEARAALLDAVLPLGCALAVENRLPEPVSLPGRARRLHWVCFGKTLYRCSVPLSKTPPNPSR